jgi:hypothetical protein
MKIVPDTVTLIDVCPEAELGQYHSSKLPPDPFTGRLGAWTHDVEQAAGDTAVIELPPESDDILAVSRWPEPVEATVTTHGVATQLPLGL